jgi:imidazolonepropionase
MTAACLNLRMTPDEALVAVTINAALALGLDEEIGSLEAGKVADLVIWNVPTTRQIPYWPAADLVRAVVTRGRVVVDRTDAG